MKSNKIFFSIIVPCYNVEDTLEGTIDSILKQDFNNYEIVAVDDGSFDNTSQILNNYKLKNNIKVITQSNKGLGAARNSGIKASDGIYICLLDADDLWVPNKLTKIYEIIKNKRYSLISNDEIIVSNNYLFYLRNNPPKNLSNLLISGNTLSPSAITIKKEIFDKVGFFKEGKKFLGVEDWDFWIRVIDNGEKIKHFPEPLGIYRRDIQNMSKSKEFTKRIINIHRNNSRYFHSKGIISTADIKNWETFLLISNFINHPLKTNLISIREHLIKGGFRYLLTYSFIRIFFKLIFRKIQGIVLTLSKYKRLKCIAKELL
ncbi:glycosyltransferase [uncultured Prochlorococcus sp.]|uniref:glycosyltransferase family 2 protein n=1 Tax=uncultured Prochlorococcus sp. TaxID=159733 RepID=UPI002589FA52|nr:glycosyltransferase [uncultured Prochlorococcus sp.]